MGTDPHVVADQARRRDEAVLADLHVGGDRHEVAEEGPRPDDRRRQEGRGREDDRRRSPAKCDRSIEQRRARRRLGHRHEEACVKGPELRKPPKHWVPLDIAASCGEEAVIEEAEELEAPARRIDVIEQIYSLAA